MASGTSLVKDSAAAQVWPRQRISFHTEANFSQANLESDRQIFDKFLAPHSRKPWCGNDLALFPASVCVAVVCARPAFCSVASCGEPFLRTLGSGLRSPSPCFFPLAPGGLRGDLRREPCSSCAHRGRFLLQHVNGQRHVWHCILALVQAGRFVANFDLT